MRKVRLILNTLAVSVFYLACLSVVHAQASQTFVSSTGNDANTCTKLSPCKTFAGAQPKTAAEGEIDALDQGGFGAVTITKSLTINGGVDTFAMIHAPSVTAVTVSAATTDVVIVRNLSLDGQNTGIDGIKITAAQEVHVEFCQIFNFTADAIEVAAAANTHLFLQESTMRDNGNAGLLVSTAAGLARATVDRCWFRGNASGLIARDFSRVMISNSLLTGNSSFGILAEALTAGRPAQVNVEHSIITHNANKGIQAGSASALANSTVRISENEITNNTNEGVLVSTNGVVETYQNNKIRGNGANNCPLCTVVSQS
ncbi:MAG: hypothetical protein QOE33_1952 [Acidobacteriota bacterium]|nr:hypothetical protein [Acidobacteriota bacterium]